MKIILTIIISLSSCFSLIFSQEERKVLVEVFTNSHCSLCPGAHNILDDYIEGPNGESISYIFYHMVYPYADDSLYYQSIEGSNARNDYFSPIPATPQGWFDGLSQGSYSGWTSILDNLVSTQSPLKINLSGIKNTSEIRINAELSRSGNIPDTDLVIHFIIVENVYYAGRNGITNHKNVMRKMFPTPAGKSLSIGPNEVRNIDQLITLQALWNVDSLSVVVFVQSSGSKTVYQSASIRIRELNLTDIDNHDIVPNNFSLEQNFPNPFNPSTKIRFAIPVTLSPSMKSGQASEGSLVTLKVYDVLGNEVATLVDEYKTTGSYEINFDASQLSSGIYFYKLQAGNIVETKKMILLK